uniref:Uncharacterized protein n=1 Tax=Quercus lobata TaxID=97700 RepID=A0A7N2LT01_QUELO
MDNSYNDMRSGKLDFLFCCVVYCLFVWAAVKAFNLLYLPCVHVSCLKAKLGHKTMPLSLLPSVNSQGILASEPVVVLQTRSCQLRNRTITQLLI